MLPAGRRGHAGLSRQGAGKEEGGNQALVHTYNSVESWIPAGEVSAEQLSTKAAHAQLTNNDQARSTTSITDVQHPGQIYSMRPGRHTAAAVADPQHLRQHHNEQIRCTGCYQADIQQLQPDCTAPVLAGYSNCQIQLPDLQHDHGRIQQLPDLAARSTARSWRTNR